MNEKYDINDCPEAVRRREVAKRKSDDLVAQDRIRAAQCARDTRALDLAYDLIPHALAAWARMPSTEAEQAVQALLREQAELTGWTAASVGAQAALDDTIGGADRELAALDLKLTRRMDMDALMDALEKGDEEGLTTWSLLGHGDAERALLDFVQKFGQEDGQVENVLERAAALGWTGPAR